MTDVNTDYKCPPPKEPADQPKKPERQCPDLTETKCPVLADPPKCPPDPHHKCWCPKGSDKDKDCIEKLIDAQTELITSGDKAKSFKTDLEGLLAKAQTAAQEYTREKYENLVRQWVEQDCDIAELIRKVVCAVPCWRCIIECHICPLLYVLRDAELRLFSDRTPTTKVDNLHELLFCQTQDKAEKERTFNRIKAVLTAWEKPVQTIEKVLTDNAKLIADITKALGTDGPKVVYDLFFKLIPLHLAIAPPRVSDSDPRTKIAKEYTQFCHCDWGKPDTCCGPDVGEWSLRQRLIGPQPYLIDPNAYFTIICCLVDKRWRPAREQLSRAEAAIENTQILIRRYTAVIENGLKNFEKDAEAAIPAVVDCSKYEPDQTEYDHA